MGYGGKLTREAVMLILHKTGLSLVCSWLVSGSRIIILDMCLDVSLWPYRSLPIGVIGLFRGQINRRASRAVPVA